MTENDSQPLLTGFKQIPAYIRYKNKGFWNNIATHGGIAFYVRALTAQILFLFLAAFLLRKIIPLDSNLYSYSIIIFFGLVWGRGKELLKNKLPPAYLSFSSGEFLYDCDLKFLNRFIMCIIFIYLVILFIPAIFLKPEDKLKIAN